MQLKNKPRIITALAYLGVLAGFILMYFFMLPQMDVFLLSLYVENDLRSAIDFSLFYGNGRLLGNILGIHFSNHFMLATFAVPIFLTAIAGLLNAILLDNNPYTIFPIALFVAVPSVGVVQKCYYTFASFANYVMPIAFFLFGIYAFGKLAKERASLSSVYKSILGLLGFVSTVCACLFSENTTILVVVAALAMVVYDYIRVRKHSVPLWLHLGAALAGAAIMVLVPIVTKTNGNLSGYRHIATSFSELMQLCIFSFAKFADILNRMYLLLFLFSLGMILLCSKQTRFASTLKPLQVGIFAAYPILCLILNQFDLNDPLSYTTVLKLADAALVALLAVNVVVTVLLVDDPLLRLRCILMSIIVICTVAPMMIVNANGIRTFYTTFICMTAFSIMLIRICLPPQIAKIAASIHLGKTAAAVSAGCFAILTAVFLLTSLYNFDFYVLRCKDVADAILAGEAPQAAVLPFAVSSMESYDEQTIFLAFDATTSLEPEVIVLTQWDGFENFRNEIVKNPINALRFAFDNWTFKDPQYPNSLIS